MVPSEPQTRVSASPKKPSEFKRYRQALTALYLGTAGAAFLLLTASVVRELLFRRPVVELPHAAFTDEDPNPEDLLACNDMVRELLVDLSARSCDLLAAPTRDLPTTGDRGAISSEWSDFSRNWRDRWDVINARCRFSDLSDSTLGVAYDRMAQVHGDLPTMRLKYQSLIVRFDEEQAAELAEMRRALDQSRAALAERLDRDPRRSE